MNEPKDVKESALSSMLGVLLEPEILARPLMFPIDPVTAPVTIGPKSR